MRHLFLPGETPGPGMGPLICIAAYCESDARESCAFGTSECKSRPDTRPSSEVTAFGKTSRFFETIGLFCLSESRLAAACPYGETCNSMLTGKGTKFQRETGVQLDKFI